MGSEFLILVFVPLTIMILLTLIFGTVSTSAVISDVNVINGTVSNVASRENCEDVYSQCSNTDCNLLNILGNFPCGDTFYVLLIIGSVLALPFLIIALPALIMIPLFSISALGYTYSLSDFWWLYAPMWSMFGFGILKVIW